MRIASDIYAQNDEQREAAGLPPPRYNDQQRSNQQATDAEVYDRFKKRYVPVRLQERRRLMTKG